MNRAQYVISLFEYGSDGKSKFRHKVAGIGLGLAGLSVAALATHAATKGQSLGASLGDLGHHISGEKANWTIQRNPNTAVVHQDIPKLTPSQELQYPKLKEFSGYGVNTHTAPSGTTTPYGSSSSSPSTGASSGRELTKEQLDKIFPPKASLGGTTPSEPSSRVGRIGV